MTWLSYWYSLLRRHPKLIIVHGAVLTAICAFLVVYPSLGSINAKAPPKFAVQVGTRPRLFGLTLPASLVKSDPAQVKAELNIQPGIIGRIQSIDDRFDIAWANDLLAKGQRPWITLVFHLNGAPAYMSSLPAIANGIYDQNLRDWALSIRDFGQPVYITILQHVDRNWSLSSAVTNGGIPQDVPHAWLHVRQIFDEMKVDNVAWVWAPADPVHDQNYAPPSSSIDIVLLSMISYPNTKWVDPRQAIQDVALRYPKTPLFVEVSAEGTQEQKSAWLTQVGMAIPAEPDVIGLMYHDGSPDIAANAEQHVEWSMASDLLSLHAAQTMVKTAGLQTLEVKQ